MIHTIKAKDFFGRALLIFTLLVSEILISFLDALIDRRSISQLMIWSKHW